MWQGVAKLGVGKRVLLTVLSVQAAHPYSPASARTHTAELPPPLADTGHPDPQDNQPADQQGDQRNRAAGHFLLV